MSEVKTEQKSKPLSEKPEQESGVFPASPAKGPNKSRTPLTKRTKNFPRAVGKITKNSAKTAPKTPKKSSKTVKKPQKATENSTEIVKNRTFGRERPHPFSFARWLDEWKMTFAGVALALKKPKFIAVALITLIFFGTLMNLLTNGLSQFLLLFKLDWGGKWLVLASAFLATFGVGRAFLDWLSVFAIACLQGLLVGLIAIVWKHHRARPWQKPKKTAKKLKKTGKTTKNAQESTNSVANTPKVASVASTTFNSGNLANAESAGIVAGLAILSAGCPTCGTSLLLPLLGVFSSSAGTLAGAVSGVVLAIAVLIALFSLKRIGREAYAIIITERRQKSARAVRLTATATTPPDAGIKKSVPGRPKISKTNSIGGKNER